MPGKETGVRTPDLTYIAVARKQQVLAVAFSVDWHVIVLLERLLQFHLLECRDALVARKKSQPENGKGNVLVNRLLIKALRLGILVLLYVFSLVPANGYTLFYFCLALFFYFFIYRKAINIFLINRLLNKFFENNSFSY